MARVQIEGLDKLTKKLLKLPANLTKGLKREINLSAILIQSEAIKSISKGSRSGVRYKRGGKMGQRSAPGEFPKTDRGRLVASIKTDSPPAAKGLIARVGTNLNYGRFLEFGTLKMAARPWLVRTLKLNIKTISQKISNEVKKVLRSSK